jgi:hypothetical protein
MLGIKDSTFRMRIIAARQVFLRWWHQHETPSRPYQADRRSDACKPQSQDGDPGTCQRGHPRNEANTRRRPSDGRRRCRVCERDGQLRRAARREAAA